MTNTIKNITLCIATLLFVNWLLNMAKINELKRKVDEKEAIQEYLETQIKNRKAYIDSLERVLIDLELDK